MSFDIYVTAFNDEQPFRFPVADLLERFSGHLEFDDGARSWRLKFDEGPSLARLFAGDDELTSGFTVSRPPDYMTFWEIIAGVLKALPCVLFWPSTTGNNAVMGSLDLMQHLPDGFVDAFGIPLVSTDAATIRKFVAKDY